MTQTDDKDSKGELLLSLKLLYNEQWSKLGFHVFGISYSEWTIMVLGSSRKECVSGIYQTCQAIPHDAMKVDNCLYQQVKKRVTQK